MIMLMDDGLAMPSWSMSGNSSKNLVIHPCKSNHYIDKEKVVVSTYATCLLDLEFTSFVFCYEMLVCRKVEEASRLQTVSVRGWIIIWWWFHTQHSWYLFSFAYINIYLFVSRLRRHDRAQASRFKVYFGDWRPWKGVRGGGLGANIPSGSFEWLRFRIHERFDRVRQSLLCRTPP